MRFWPCGPTVPGRTALTTRPNPIRFTSRYDLAMAWNGHDTLQNSTYRVLTICAPDISPRDVGAHDMSTHDIAR